LLQLAKRKDIYSFPPLEKWKITSRKQKCEGEKLFVANICTFEGSGPGK